jgi:hypothetical protein
MLFCRKILIIFCILSTIFFAVKADNNPAVKYTISGKIKDKASGEELVGSNVYIKELKTGTVANSYGFYSLSIPAGNYTILYSYLGYETFEKVMQLNKNVVINVELELKNKTLQEVVISDKRTNENVVNNEMSVVKMNIETIKKIPSLMGEVDVLKALQLLPGVQSTGEGMSGFSVRGGSNDQNLILLDEATVYNASHLMGFFSVFNNDAIKDIKLYKGDIPSQYGGRLSSLLDVRMKDGNMKKLEATGGIGVISSRLSIEGPVIRDKMSFIIAGRRSYADIFLPFARDKDLRKNKLYFYDLSAKINYIINENNRIFLSGYFGKDVFKFTDIFKMSWGNNTETVRWNHLFSQKLFSNLSFILSDYKYNLGASLGSVSFDWISNLKDLGLKYDFSYYLNTNNTIKYGLSGIYHTINPGYAEADMGTSSTSSLQIPKNHALEYAAYLSNEHKLTDLFTVEYGLRYSIFQNIGKAKVFKYDSKDSVIETKNYSSGKIFNTYSGLEPRLGMKYLLNEASSIKASYSRTIQYIQLASNSTGGSPLDVWFPSGPNVKPQVGDQIAIGYFKNLKENLIETSVEVYYKKMYNQIDFKDHANLLLNEKMEGELRFGDALSYGIEFFIKKNTGKFTGWLSYTLSKAERKIPYINNGNPYPASYDKPNNISLVLNYEFSKRLSASANWVYATGSPVTFPTGRFEYGNTVIPIYSERNSYRFPDYHRLDLSVTLKNRQKENKKYSSEWNFSVFNVYNRHNTWLIRFQQNEYNPDITEAYRLYLFSVIPSVTYNFKF